MHDSSNSGADLSGLSGKNDAELVQMARQGQERAFHEIVDRHAQSLYGLAVALLGDASDAEDAVQETLAAGYKGLRTYRQEASLKTWLTKILVRRVATELRKRFSRRVTGPVWNDMPRAGVASAESAVDARLDVQQAMQALGPEHREVIVLRELQCFSYDEIAAVLDVPRGTVESRLFRARRELARLLRDYLI